MIEKQGMQDITGNFMSAEGTGNNQMLQMVGIFLIIDGVLLIISGILALIIFALSKTPVTAPTAGLTYTIYVWINNILLIMNLGISYLIIYKLLSVWTWGFIHGIIDMLLGIILIVLGISFISSATDELDKIEDEINAAAGEDGQSG